MTFRKTKRTQRLYEQRKMILKWINHLNLTTTQSLTSHHEISSTIVHLSEKMQDGILILTIMDHIKPQTVDWSLVHLSQSPLTRNQKLENLQRVVKYIQTFEQSNLELSKDKSS